jgi:hypothetical protein
VCPFSREEIFCFDMKKGISMLTSTDDKMMKLHIPDQDKMISGETVWAVCLGNNTCMINNIPFLTHKCGLEDIVQYVTVDGMAEFVKVIKKKTISYGIL